MIRTRNVICNADPKLALDLIVPDAVPAAYRERLQGWRVTSGVVKFNAALRRLPTFTAAPGEAFPYRTSLDVTTGLDELQRAFESCRRGVPTVAFGEVYFQTGFDPTPAPPGRHLMSVFGQYAPYTLADGDWDSQRDHIGRQFVDLIARFAPDIGDCLEQVEVLGPPDIERRVGLTGGHIFQGEVLPDQMWLNRLAPRTPIPGFYLCGAATHPGGSVIGLNGRNAAMAVLADAAGNA
jgi:phytoene dehydrogenase-like protein